MAGRRVDHPVNDPGRAKLAGETHLGEQADWSAVRARGQAPHPCSHLGIHSQVVRALPLPPSSALFLQLSPSPSFSLLFPIPLSFSLFLPPSSTLPSYPPPYLPINLHLPPPSSPASPAHSSRAAQVRGQGRVQRQRPRDQRLHSPRPRWHASRRHCQVPRRFKL
eukprot:407297-Rhodomonas_salina.1